MTEKNKMGYGRSRKKGNQPRSRKKKTFTVTRLVFLLIFLIIGAAVYFAQKDPGGYFVKTAESAAAGHGENTGPDPGDPETSGSDLSAEEIRRQEEEESRRAEEEESLKALEESRRAEEERIRQEEEERIRKEEVLQALLNSGYHLIDQADPDRIVLRFAGDILFDPAYAVMASMLQRSGGGFPDIGTGFDAQMMALMRNADVFVINNEFPYSERGAQLTGKKYTFRAKPAYASLMNTIGADLAVLANNHVNDYGRDAMLDTFAALEAAGVHYAGAGRNIEEAAKPAYFTNGDVKIAIICTTQIERTANPDTVAATDSSPGVFRCLYDMDRLKKQIRNAKDDGCFVIVYVHWGTESTERVDDWQLKQGRQIAEAGADLIVGDHPHVLQRMDWLDTGSGADSGPVYAYAEEQGNSSQNTSEAISGQTSEQIYVNKKRTGKVPLIYSLGNYLFNSKTLDTCLYEITLDARDAAVLSVRFIPAIQSGCRTRLAEGSEAARIIKHMDQMSANVHLNEDGFLELP